MSEENYIRGSGGLKRAIFGGPKNQEDANTLFSSAKAKVIDLISEGEISGLINGKKSVFSKKNMYFHDFAISTIGRLQTTPDHIGFPTICLSAHNSFHI